MFARVALPPFNGVVAIMVSSMKHMAESFTAEPLLVLESPSATS
jgi:hypothetical protein